jgi:Na+-transporting NADH:ubiquinone oxidoreductase subunit F
MILLSATTIVSSIVVFLFVILTLVSVLLFVKAKLTPSGKITIKINGEKEIVVDGGDTLLTTLSNEGIFLPSACGGGGTCIQCTCQVSSGGGSILPTEKPHFSRKEIANDYRLSCQVKVREDMDIHIPEEVFGVKKWEATVVSN